MHSFTDKNNNMIRNNIFMLFATSIFCLASCNSITNSTTSSSTSSAMTSSSTSTSESSIAQTTSSSTSKSPSTTSSSISTSEKQMTINDCNGTIQINGYIENGYSPLFKDPNFKEGFNVTKTFYGAGESPYHLGKKIDFYNIYKDANTFSWHIAQWSSKYDLMEDNGYEIESDETGLIHTITSKGKIVNDNFTPAKQVRVNSLTGEITLTANASVEYEKPRTSSDPWVHLLFEQSTFTLNGNLVNISSANSIIMEADYEVTKCIDMINGQANSNIHAAQLVWYITLQNLNKSSKGYGKYIWFGLTLYDNRSVGKTTSLYSQYDNGTGTGIYSPSSSYYLYSNNGEIPTIGKRVTAKIDVKSIAKTAYDEGKKKGYFDDTNFEDLALGGMNFGYELPGTYDISSNFYAINIFAK